jgi:putative nucleotidyltransferase with HDIG domain
MIADSKPNASMVRERIQKLSSLPSLAVVKYQLIKTINKENASIEDIAEIIKHDQALASRVIAIANSAFLGYPGRIGAIEQAVMLLGFDLVRSISLAASIFNVFASQYGNFKQIWAHSYVVANIASALCGKADGAERGNCFLAGLLHDIGRLALFRIMSESAPGAGAHELLKLRGEELLTAEEKVAGCSHTEAAKWFLEHLCFPEEIIIPIQNHHMPAYEGPLKGVSNRIFLAEGLSDIICPHIMHDGEWTDAHKRVFNEAGLSQNDIDDISAFVAAEESSISQFFDL